MINLFYSLFLKRDDKTNSYLIIVSETTIIGYLFKESLN